MKFSSKVEVLDDPEQAIITVALTVEEVEEVPVVATETTAAGVTPDAATPAKDEKKEEKK